eukprot:4252293-Prymnesium_polylepis.1
MTGAGAWGAPLARGSRAGARARALYALRRARRDQPSSDPCEQIEGCKMSCEWWRVQEEV